MPAVAVDVNDLAPFAEIESVKAQAMIDDAMALAARVAPCILTAEFEFDGAAKAIIRGAILRWNEAGAGVKVQESVGPFAHSFDQGSSKRGRFWPTEITDLEKLCRDSGAGGAFGIDTVGYLTPQHADICALNFGATYCSCGAVLAGAPLWGE